MALMSCLPSMLSAQHLAVGSAWIVDDCNNSLIEQHAQVQRAQSVVRSEAACCLLYVPCAQRLHQQILMQAQQA